MLKFESAVTNHYELERNIKIKIEEIYYEPGTLSVTLWICLP